MQLHYSLHELLTGSGDVFSFEKIAFNCSIRTKEANSSKLHQPIAFCRQQHNFFHPSTLQRCISANLVSIRLVFIAKCESYIWDDDGRVVESQRDKGEDGRLSDDVLVIRAAQKEDYGRWLGWRLRAEDSRPRVSAHCISPSLPSSSLSPQLSSSSTNEHTQISKLPFVRTDETGPKLSHLGKEREGEGEIQRNDETKHCNFKIISIWEMHIKILWLCTNHQNCICGRRTKGRGKRQFKSTNVTAPNNLPFVSSFICLILKLISSHSLIRIPHLPRPSLCTNLNLRCWRLEDGWQLERRATGKNWGIEK